MCLSGYVIRLSNASVMMFTNTAFLPHSPHIYRGILDRFLIHHQGKAEPVDH